MKENFAYHNFFECFDKFSYKQLHPPPPKLSRRNSWTILCFYFKNSPFIFPENTLGPALAIHSRVRSSSLRNSLQPRTQFSPKIAQIKEDPIEVIIDKLAVIEHCSLYMASTIHTSYKRDEKKMQWIFIAKIVDRLLLIVFLIVFLLTSAMILAFEFYNDYSS